MHPSSENKGREHAETPLLTSESLIEEGRFAPRSASAGFRSGASSEEVEPGNGEHKMLTVRMPQRSSIEA